MPVGGEDTTQITVHEVKYTCYRVFKSKHYEVYFAANVDLKTVKRDKSVLKVGDKVIEIESRETHGAAAGTGIFVDDKLIGMVLSEGKMLRSNAITWKVKHE